MGTVVATPADAVAKVDIVITSVTGPDALRSAFVGPTGALAAARGQLFVEMSTAGPDVLDELAPRIATTGSTLVDAPVVGAPPLVRHGRELILAGGQRADVQFARPVLERLGELRHVGPLGSGARLKLVANSMLGALILIAAELQAAGERAGFDPDTIFNLLTRLVPLLEVRRAGYVEDRHEPAMFALRDLLKDLDLALQVFHRADAHVPITALVREWVDEAAAENPDLDISAVIRRYAESVSTGTQHQSARRMRAAHDASPR